MGIKQNLHNVSEVLPVMCKLILSLSSFL